MTGGVGSSDSGGQALSVAAVSGVLGVGRVRRGDEERPRNACLEGHSLLQAGRRMEDSNDAVVAFWKEPGWCGRGFERK